jgi:hypothetical protein
MSECVSGLVPLKKSKGADQGKLASLMIGMLIIAALDLGSSSLGHLRVAEGIYMAVSHRRYQDWRSVPDIFDAFAEDHPLVSFDDTAFVGFIVFLLRVSDTHKERIFCRDGIPLSRS